MREIYIEYKLWNLICMHCACCSSSMKVTWFENNNKHVSYMSDCVVALSW